MKIGFTSYSFAAALRAKTMKIDDAIRFAAGIGAAHMEISPGKFLEMSPENIDLMVRTAKECGIELSSYTIGANFVQPDAAAVENEISRVEKEVETAAKLGVTRMRHDCGWRPQPECSYANFEKDLPIFVDACGRIADKAKTYGIVTSIENHGFYVQASERVQRVVLAVNRDNFRTTLDVGNFLCVDEDPECAVMNNLPFASFIHFKDFHIRRQVTDPAGFIKTLHGRYLRGAVTGDGDVDLPSICRLIKASAYDGFLSIEYEGREECKFACTRAIKNVRELFAD
ncbi:MAG: sugar phosphate isomerase/epimerase [Lentisphaeria bacterium]|nr:sugar phosphate isomerase/epimerase [Lentisphaeria bacterium]